MVTNSYFNQYSHVGQQNLMESLIIESIRVFGMNMYYLPKTRLSFDEVFRESDVNEFTTAVLIETYLKTVDGFNGDGKFISQYVGLEIRDQATFTLAKSVFTTLTGLDRPREGDLMYLPLDKKCYEIKFVEHQAVFYQLGKLNTYDLTVELLEYNGQIFNTGIAEIDAIDAMYEMDGAEDTTITDWSDQSSEIQDLTPGLLDFSEKDPFSRGQNL